MTREQAVETARELGATHEDRGTHRWVPRERPDGSWEVAKVGVPHALRQADYKETVGAKPKPPEADDPRPAYLRNAPGATG